MREQGFVLAQASCEKGGWARGRKPTAAQIKAAERAEHMVKAACPPGGVTLDPFMGSGTTALAARSLGRSSIGIELSSDYCALAAKRLAQQTLLGAA